MSSNARKRANCTVKKEEEAEVVEIEQEADDKKPQKRRKKQIEKVDPILAVARMDMALGLFSRQLKEKVDKDAVNTLVQPVLAMCMEAILKQHATIVQLQMSVIGLNKDVDALKVCTFSSNSYSTDVMRTPIRPKHKRLSDVQTIKTEFKSGKEELETSDSNPGTPWTDTSISSCSSTDSDLSDFDFQSTAFPLTY